MQETNPCAADTEAGTRLQGVEQGAQRDPQKPGPMPSANGAKAVRERTVSQHGAEATGRPLQTTTSTCTPRLKLKTVIHPSVLQQTGSLCRSTRSGATTEWGSTPGPIAQALAQGKTLLPEVWVPSPAPLEHAAAGSRAPRAGLLSERWGWTFSWSSPWCYENPRVTTAPKERGRQNDRGNWPTTPTPISHNCPQGARRL